MGTLSNGRHPTPENFLRVRFRVISLSSCLQLKMHAWIAEDPVYVTIFGSHLSSARKGNKPPIQFHTGRYGGLAKKRLGSQTLEAKDKTLYDKSRAGELTVISLNLLGDIGDAEDTFGRHAKLIITGKLTLDQLTAFADRARSGDAQQPLNENFLGLMHGNSLRNPTVYL